MTQRDWFGAFGGAGDGDANGGKGRGAGRPGGGGPGGEGHGARRAPSPGGRPGTGRRWGPTLAVLAVVLLAVTFGVQLWTEFMWYESVGFRSVLTTRLLAQVVLFVVGAVVIGGLVWSSLHLAYRNRPIYAPVTLEQQSLDRYREALEPMRRLVFIALPAVVGLFAGMAASSQWQTALLWLNREPFGVNDEQFNMDIGFFVFTLPWLSFLVGFLTMAFALAIIAAGVTHYVYGGIQLQSKTEKTTSAARIHLSLLAAGLILVRAAGYWLERYDLTTQDAGRITGLTYTDANAVLPTRGILAIAAVLCAVLFIATIWTRSWRLPIVGISGLLILAVAVGGIFPALMQSLRVRPSEAVLETPYIQKAIDATLDAYNLDGTEVIAYEAETEISRNQLRDDAESIPGIRLMDPSILSPTFRQLQGVRSYYQFPEALDVDRYQFDGQTQDAVVAVRELDLDGVPGAQRNWVNDHTVYTHGFGFVAAYGNQRSSDGQPVFFQRNIPPVGELGEFEPRIYFGESSPVYSIVGAPEGAPPRELDYPDDSNASGQRNTTYEGDGGVAIGTFLRKAAYAIKYRQLEIMLSDSLNPESRLLDHREPRERVERVAPWLELDGNPYPAVVDGRIQWIIDGYTTSRNYPYSQLMSVGEATTDSVVTEAANVRAIEAEQVNYIRNSVKATVDAYDGSVRLYAWNEEDPLLQAWSNVFDNTVLPMSEIGGELMSHLRYPEDLFKVQREILQRYHVDEGAAFFSGQDFWNVSDDPSVGGEESVPMPPYYLSIAMPGQEQPTFSLTSTFIPGQDRQNLVGYLAVDADAGDQRGERREGYGQMRLLELPRDTTVRGPGQFQNDIESSNQNSEAFEQTLSQFLSLNRQQGSNVQIGNLLTLPVGGGMLYVEPIYVSARGDTSYPLQRLTVVAFGDRLAWSDTLDGALDQLFAGESGAQAPDAGTGTDNPEEPDPGGEAPPGDSPTQSPTAPPTGGPTEPPATDSQALEDALADIQQAYEDGQQALADGDFAAYGEAQQRLEDAIQRAVEASPEGGSVEVTPPGGSTDEPTGEPTGEPTDAP